ncbi:MAG: CPBP family intramembrane glutamic endopeptidase [Candidatus Eiseniibacteriota bacterium]
MTVLDVLFVIVFAVAYPLYAARTYPRTMRGIAEFRPRARIDAYRETMLWEWGLAAAGVAVWLAGGRTFAQLGFRAPSGAGFWIALVLALLGTAALALQLRSVQRSEDDRRELKTSLGGPLVFLPRTTGEEREFALVSITAGICEELLYRGWLIAWLAPVAGTPAAAVLSTLAFGAVHLYGGPSVALRATAMGAVLCGLFLLSGSLWVPILVHAMVDRNMGQLAAAAFRDDAPPEGTRVVSGS